VQEVLMKIHQTYRIQYLKDVILPRSLDDGRADPTLSSLMLFNNVDVVLGLYQDPTFLPGCAAGTQSLNVTLLAPAGGVQRKL